MQRYLIWDFDGTLGYREGQWSGALMDVLRSADPNCLIDREQIVPHLKAGFPWHAPETCHPSGRSAEAWWLALAPVFLRAFQSVGFDEQRALELAAAVRNAYCRFDNWRLFEETLDVLEELSCDGWTHFLLSNHVPELPHILEHLKVRDRFARVFNSAETGYEKPHPRAFAAVLEIIEAGTPVWMIGDNIRADVDGAAAAGIPAILVRQQKSLHTYQCAHLRGVRDILGAHQPMD
jgi:putative hydrolase of the HAD superfamily